ncbi:MAG: NAD(P)-dependent oxidoreductase [Candidatus Diapherotrites archaeon]|nr:NAD(P)-dependent oxidoreductase [Candidatus Diapherotrites archaeon]
MRVLVTGSKGFIGQAVIKVLQEKGHSIHEFDYSIGQNILRREDLEKALNDAHAVIHLAALTDETKSEKELFEVNVEGTKNVLESAGKAGVKHVIYLSTVGIYGPTTKEALNEESPCNPITPYEQSKKAAEEVVQEYQEVVPITILRSALALGPSTYWAQIFKTVKKGFPLIGKGENKWQIVYIKDLAQAIAFVLGKEEVFGETYLVAEEKGKTLFELVQRIGTLVGRPEIKTIPVWLGMALAHVFALQGKITGKRPLLIPKHVRRMLKERNYDISKLKALGWKPRYDTDAALKETFEALKEKKMI